jgi:hypothetical protein
MGAQCPFIFVGFVSFVCVISCLHLASPDLSFFVAAQFIMSRHSKRQKLIKKKKLVIQQLEELLQVAQLGKDEDSEADFSESEIEELEDMHALAVDELEIIESQRYLNRGPYRSTDNSRKRFEQDLNEGNEELTSVPWLKADEFLEKFRMSRESFWDLVGLINDDPIFQKNDSRGRPQMPVSHQLMTTLRAFGNNGSFSNGLRHVFATGKGSGLVFNRRVCTALRNKRECFIKWPDENERVQISRRIEAICGLPNCIGIVDGTLFPLAFRPRTHDASDYKGRKHLYSISSIFINDDERFIRYYQAGWPGCTHDNRIARNSDPWINHQKCFSPTQWMMGDSAFENTNFMVSCFTAPSGQSISREKELFNRRLSKVRVISEHTIGLLKRRFPWLRSIRKKITDDPSTLRDVLLFLDACVILYNFLLQKKKEQDTNTNWMDNDDDASLMDDPSRMFGEEDELFLPVPEGARPDMRRDQLMYFAMDEL